MAKKTKDTKSLLKWKKKRWYKIVAPKAFREVVLGESFVLEASSLVGKTVKANLMNITGNARKQNINVKFEVTEIQNDKALTKVVSYEMISSAIKRLVRRKRDKVELTPVFESSDKVKFRIKPIIVTRSNCANSIHTQMRKLVMADLAEYAVKNTFEQTIYDILAGKLQSGFKSKLKKLYPVRVFDVRAIEIVKSKKIALSDVLPYIPKENTKSEKIKEDAQIQEEQELKEQANLEAEKVIEESNKEEDSISDEDDLEEDEKKSE